MVLTVNGLLVFTVRIFFADGSVNAVPLDVRTSGATTGITFVL